MNLVVLFLTTLFTLFGIFTCAVLPTSPSLVKLVDSASNVGHEQIASSSQLHENKLSENVDDHAGNHDQVPRIVPRKGATNKTDDDIGKVSTEAHPINSISADRASTTITKDSESKTNKTSESSNTATGKDNATATSNDTATNSDTASSYASDKYSPSVSKSTGTDTSHTSSSITSKSDNTSSTDTSKSSVTKSTESMSSKSSSINKKPLVTYSVEDDPTLLNVPRVRQKISPLTLLDVNAEAANSAYLPPSNDIVIDRMPSKRELYIFPLVVLIFLVPMVLGVGIIVLRRVKDYWSTRHYRRMDFLVDGMYNT